MAATVWIALAGTFVTALGSLVALIRLTREWASLRLSQEKLQLDIAKAQAELHKLRQEAADRERERAARETERHQESVYREEERLQREQERFALTPEMLQREVVEPIRFELRERAAREARVTIESAASRFASDALGPVSREMSAMLSEMVRQLGVVLTATVDERLRAVEEALKQKKGILW